MSEQENKNTVTLYVVSNDSVSKDSFLRILYDSLKNANMDVECICIPQTDMRQALSQVATTKPKNIYY